MIAGLVRQHPVFGTMPKLLGVAVATSTFVTNLLTFQLMRNGQGADPLVWLQLTVFLVAGGGLLMTQGHRRTSPWHLGVPLAAEQLWRSHYLALLLGMFTLLAAQAATLLAFLGMLDILIDRPLLPWGQVPLLLARPALLLIALAATVAAYRPDLADLAEGAAWGRLRFLLPAGAGLLLLVLASLPLVVSLVPTVLAGTAAGRARRRLPAALSLGNGRSGPGRGLPATAYWQGLRAAPDLHRPRSPLVSLALLNLLFKVPYPWIFVLALFAAFFAAILAGFPLYESRSFNETMRMGNFFLTIYLLFAMTGEFTLRLHKVDALPVDRRALLRYLMVPGMVAILLGYGGASLWLSHRGAPQELVHFQDSYGKYGAVVAPSFNTIGRRGGSVQVAAPWGESHPAVARHPVPGFPSPWAARSPYLTDGGPTSREFLAWQLSRAVEHVYGTRIDPAELEARYVQSDESGQPFVPRDAFTVARDFGLSPRPGGPVGAFLCGGLLTGWFLVTGLFFHLLGRGRTVRWARVAWWSFMGGLFVMHLLQVFGQVPLWNAYGGATLLLGTARSLGNLGAMGQALAYLVAGGLTLAAWRYCQARFLALEAPRS